MDLLKRAKSIRTMSIVGICLIFTFILVPVTLILIWISSIKIMSTDWKNEQLNNQKALWGGLSIFSMGITGTLIFSNLAISILKQEK